jgi:hypothetical protein
MQLYKSTISYDLPTNPSKFLDPRAGWLVQRVEFDYHLFSNRYVPYVLRTTNSPNILSTLLICKPLKKFMSHLIITKLVEYYQSN